MAKRDIQQGRVRISNPPAANSPIKKVDDVFIVVTQAFCPNGHNVIDETTSEPFDGYPGIRLRVAHGDRSGEVHLSPFHGDNTKRGMIDWEPGTKLEVRCPICNVLLPRLAKCHCDTGNGQEGDMIKLFLSPALNDSHIMAFCNVWGCRHSRTIDNWQLISEFIDGSIAD
jgi:hypothetical protein